MEIFEILDGRLYQSGAPMEAAEWDSIHARGIDVVVDLFGTLDPGVPTAPNSILYIFWPIEDVHCHMGKSRSGLLNALVAMEILGISGREAVEYVRSRRPGALGNAVFVQYLEALPAPAPAAPPAPTRPVSVSSTVSPPAGGRPAGMPKP